MCDKIKTRNLSSFHFTIVLPISETGSSLIHMLVTTYLTIKNPDQAFIITMKARINYIKVFGDKSVECISHYYGFADLTYRIPASSRNYSLKSIQF